MNTVTINGVELEVEYFDADWMERFEKALEVYGKKGQDMKSFEGSTAEGYRKLCAITNEFFDSVFGDGTAEQLFHGKNDLMEHLKAVDLLIEEKRQAHKEMADLSNRYVQRAGAMTMNREQRRKQRKEDRNVSKEG